MEYEKYKIFRDEIAKEMWRTGDSVKKIANRFAIDEKLVKKICKKEKRIEFKQKPSHHKLLVTPCV